MLKVWTNAVLHKFIQSRLEGYRLIVVSIAIRPTGALSACALRAEWQARWSL